MVTITYAPARSTGAVTETALPCHRLDDWFPGHLCRSLNASGLVWLSDLQARIQAGGRWWTSIPRIGVGKAEGLRQRLAQVMPGACLPVAGLPSASGPVASRGRQLAALIAGAPADRLLPVPGVGLRSAHAVGYGPARPALPLPGGTAAATLADTEHPCSGGIGPQLADGASRDLLADGQAVRSWLLAHTGSDATAKSYRREMARFLLFLDQRSLTLSRCDAEACLAYQALLRDPPADWTGHRSAPLGDAAWRPFSGPLSLRSQQHAAAVLSACFTWLATRGYLQGNPWRKLQQGQMPAQAGDELPDRVLLPQQWKAILDHLEAWSASEPAAARMVFLLHFLESTGLRAAELLRARLGDLAPLGERWQLQLHGKGGRQRLIPLPSRAEHALAHYLGARGLGWDAVDRHTGLPLLASISRPAQGVSYRPLYGSMKLWLNKAIKASDLPSHDSASAARASLHWLRRACGAQALAQGLPLTGVSRGLGHANPRTTARYKLAQVEAPAPDLAQG